MMAIEPGPEGTFVLTASGTLSKQDYDRFVVEFQRVVGARKAVRLLIDFTGFRGWTLLGLWSELKFDIAHRGRFERVAIVGSSPWLTWAARLGQPFLKADVRFFAPTEVDRARDWLAGRNSSSA